MPTSAAQVPQERITMAAARAITGKHPRALRSLALAGKVPSAAKIGGEWTFDIAKLRAWASGPAPQRSRSPTVRGTPRGMYGNRPGFIYFVSGGEFVKIGWSGFDIRSRLQSLQTCCPHRLEVLHVMPGTMEGEWDLHEQFDSLREQGEWFRKSQEILDYIEELKRLP